MASVTERIAAIKQPRGGFINPSEFEATSISDRMPLYKDENIHGSIIGMAVDYLTRMQLGSGKYSAFKTSIQGAYRAETLGLRRATLAAEKLLENINGLDPKSIDAACKLVTFDVWLRSPSKALASKPFIEINPDVATTKNIESLVYRSIKFFMLYGSIVMDGFNFEPEIQDKSVYLKMRETKQGTYGGYTSVVDCGDGDYLTKDGIWDLKVLRTPPTKEHTLQLLMYYIMGKHSGQKVFKKIKKIGIFNPRLEIVYSLDVSKISPDIIKTVEDEIICY